MKRYALISVSDKTGITFLAEELVKLGFSIISTGGTAKYLSGQGIPIIPITEWTGYPEIMDGRVKTLHPKVHGGILADLDEPDHLEAMQKLDIKPIEIVVVNLYPFTKTVADPDSTEEEIIENIDIGGPTLIRSAAKNYKHVTVVTDEDDYSDLILHLQVRHMVSLEKKRKLAHKAFVHVEEYDMAIASYFRTSMSGVVPGTDRDCELPLKELEISIPIMQTTRYGENPHQKAGYFSNTTKGWEQLHGKPLSYNNLLDLDAALKAIMLFKEPTVIILKHTNPCGIGSGFDLMSAYKKAFATDPLSPFGGIIIVNKTLDVDTVNEINKIFSEIIIAPDYDTIAIDILRKRKDRRLVCYDKKALLKERPEYEVKSIISGYLVQEWDDEITSETDWKIVTEKQPTGAEYTALQFAWRAVSILKSNAIAITNSDQTLGLGTGQTSRIDSADIAINKAKHFGHDLTDAVCASDGFFPFRDSIELLSKHGIKAIIQPGGSKGDEDVIAACNEFKISMIMTGMRHFRH